MKVLEGTIESFSEEDYVQLKAFIKSKPSKRKRKDLLLLELVRTKEVRHAAVITAILELDAKSNAYHALRKRLLKLVMHFIHLKNVEEDSSLYAEVQHLMAFSRYCLKQNQSELSQKFLQRAAAMSKEHQFYGLQERIQKKQLALGTLSHQEIDEVSESYAVNQHLKQQKDKVDMAIFYLLAQIEDAKKQSRSLPYQLMVDHTLRRFNLESSAIQSPKILHKIINAIRDTLRSSKDYFDFERYLETVNNDYFSIINFSEKDHFYYLQILYATAHAYYTNRKFERGFAYARKLSIAIDKYKNDSFKEELGKYHLLYAGLQFYSGKLGDGIETLEQLHAASFDQLTPKEQNYTLLNLAYYNYSNGESKKALSYIEQLKHSDTWYEKRIGENWIIKKGIMETVILMELSENDAALKKINQVVQSHHQVLSKPAFAEIGSFLKITRQLIIEPELGSNEHYEALLSEKILASQSDVNDLQTLVYFAWLKSKRKNTSFYETLLEVTTRNLFSFA